MTDIKSILGYADFSPYRNNPYLDIQSPNGQITMENTSIPLMGISNMGEVKYMKPGKKYKYKGTNIREIPLQTGGMMPNAGYPGMLLDDTETAQYALEHAKRLRFHNNGAFKALIPMDAWNDDMMNYVDKFKIIKRRGEQFVKVRGKIPKPSAPIPPVQAELPPMQAGGTHSPIYISNPKDPRLQAYNDSLQVHTAVNNWNHKVQESKSNKQVDPMRYNSERLAALDILKKNNWTTQKGTSHDYGSTGNATEAVFPKPVQPVIYQKPQQQSKPTYADSLAAYNFNTNPNILPIDRPFFGSGDLSYKGIEPIGMTKVEGQIGKAYQLSYKKPTGSPITTQKPVVSSILQRPIHSRVVNYPTIPQYNMSTGAVPTPHNMDIPQANYDTSKPTKYSFTYPTGVGQNGQKSVYFPDQKMLDEFLKGTKGTSSQAGEGYKTATGYLQKGGYAKKLFNYIFDEGDQEQVMTQPKVAATEKLDETPPSFYDKSEQEQSDFESAMSILTDGEEFSNPYNKGFRSFSTYQEGRQALEHQLDLYKTGKSAYTTGNETLAQATGIYAPPGENNTENYVNFVSKKLGVDRNTPIKNIDTKKWADAVQQMEGNTKGNNPGNLRYLFGGYIN